MLNRFLLTITLFSVFLFESCIKDKTITGNTQSNNTINDAYIILPVPPALWAGKWAPYTEYEEHFTVINLSENDTSGVPAVVELEGTIYLAIMSRPPSFNNKIVEGVFVPDTNYYLELTDTIFRVTKHLRNTVMSIWG